MVFMQTQDASSVWLPLLRVTRHDVRKKTIASLKRSYISLTCPGHTSSSGRTQHYSNSTSSRTGTSSRGLAGAATVAIAKSQCCSVGLLHIDPCTHSKRPWLQKDPKKDPNLENYLMPHVMGSLPLSLLSPAALNSGYCNVAGAYLLFNYYRTLNQNPYHITILSPILCHSKS